MRKIGILTYFNYINYGSMLQGFATQRSFQKYLSDNNECVLINYRYLSPLVKSRSSLFWLRLKRSIHYISSLRKIYTKSKYSSNLNRKNIKFEDFVKKYLVVTKTFYRDKTQLENNPPSFKVYVTGSDQTWSPIVSGGYSETPMFLDFAVQGSKKCAYAPSLGTAELNSEDRSILRLHLQDFEIITCRENSGVKILSDLTDKEVKKVLDPTLLLTGDEWRELAALPSMTKNSYILCYFIGDKDYYRKYAERLSAELKLPLYYIPVSWKDCKSQNNLLYDVGPLEFVGLINNARVVLTDSFHGTAFSSNLNTSFYSFVKHSGGIKSADNSRLYDFLSSINLESRLIEKYDGEAINFEEIDFNTVNPKLDYQRIESLDVIKKIAQLSEK